MGEDKASLVIDGRSLLDRALDALEGARRRIVVGGERRDRFDVEFVPDTYPGQGPLGGIVTALGACRAPRIVVLPCDVPGLDASFVAELLASLDAAPDALVAVPVVGGRRQVVTIAMRAEAAWLVTDRFGQGERSIRAVLDDIDVVELPVAEGVLCDLDSPGDVARYAGGIVERSRQRRDC